MALDSNSPGDERAAGSGGERAAASGLKLVGERGAASGPTAAPGGTRSADAAAGSSEATSPAPASTRGRGARSGRQLPLWLFGVLFVAFLVTFGYQTHHAGRLESEIARLEASLAQAESRLESHRTHLLEIRGGVHDLSNRLEGLRALIDRDPTAAPDAGTTPAPAAPSAAPAAP